MNKTFKLGEVWMDADNNRIQAHGGAVYFENGIWHYGYLLNLKAMPYISIGMMNGH